MTPFHGLDYVQWRPSAATHFLILSGTAEQTSFTFHRGVRDIAGIHYVRARTNWLLPDKLLDLPDVLLGVLGGRGRDGGLGKIAIVLQKMSVETHVWARLKALLLLYSIFDAYLRLAIPLDQHKSAAVAGDGRGVHVAFGCLVAKVAFIFVFKWATDIA